MKSLFGVLSLVVVLVYSQAEELHVCDKPLGLEELKKVGGEWVLTYMAHDKTKRIEGDLASLNSSHMEIHVDLEKQTLVMNERNMMGGECLFYNYSLILPKSDDGQHRLELVEGVMSIGGTVKEYKDKATAQFFSSSDNTMDVLYISEVYGPLALMYWREGQHVDGPQNEHDKHNAMAKCLKLDENHLEDWHYHLADFCHKPSVLHTLDSDELHEVDGVWVLTSMVYDKTKFDPSMRFSSSHIELHVQPDNRTVIFHERNLVEGKCVSYEGKLVLPENSERIHRLHLEETTENIDGVKSAYNDNATAEFFKQSSGDSLEMFFKSDKDGLALLKFKREGQHVDHLEEDYEQNRRRADYLGLSGDKYVDFHYNIEADFCHKSSVLRTLDSNHLHQVDGTWTLDWMAYDNTKLHEYSGMAIESSIMEFHVQADNHTVHLHERFRIGGKCQTFTGNFTLPEMSEKIHRLKMEKAIVTADGEVTPYPGNATAQFFPESEHIVGVYFNSDYSGQVLIMLIKQGHQMDAADRERHHKEYEEKAKYLGLGGKTWVYWNYDSSAEYCP